MRYAASLMERRSMPLFSSKTSHSCGCGWILEEGRIGSEVQHPPPNRPPHYGLQLAMQGVSTHRHMQTHTHTHIYFAVCSCHMYCTQASAPSLPIFVPYIHCSAPLRQATLACLCIWLLIMLLCRPPGWTLTGSCAHACQACRSKRGMHALHAPAATQHNMHKSSISFN